MNLAALQTKLQALRDGDRFRQTRFCPPENAAPKISGGQNPQNQKNPQQQPLKNFASNDYLGLAKDPQIMAALMTGAQTWGVGSGASALLGGHSPAHTALELQLADFLQMPRVRLFGDGFLANLGVLSALLGRDDVIFVDKLAHASIYAGAQLSRAKLRRFRHNDMAHLRQMLRENQHSGGQKLIAVDSIYSMDGDAAPLQELLALAREFDAWLYIDEAHAFGVLGEGRGLVWQTWLKNGGDFAADKIADKIIVMATLGKAAGVSGAFVAAHQDVIDWLNQAASTAIYTTASSPALAVACAAALREIPQRRTKLAQNIAFFRDLAADLPFLPSDSAIFALVLGEEARALAAAHDLQKRGFFVPAIRPPTVPQGTSRLRLTLSAAHTTDDIRALVAALREICGGQI